MDKADNQLVLENQPHFGYFQAVYRSFYSRILYLDVAKRWKGFGIIYLLLVIALFTIPFSVRLIIDFTNYFNNQIAAPIQSLPELYIQNGQVVFDKPMPYLIKNEEGEVTSIIDTTGEITKIDEKWPQLMLLITKDTLYLRVPEVKFSWLKTIDQSESPEIYEQKIYPGSNELFNAKDWMAQGGIHNLKYYGQFLVYPMSICMFSCLILLALPVIALMGQLFSRVLFSWSLTFTQSCRLMAVASTPSLLIFFILLTSNRLNLGVGFILTAVLILYFCLAVIVFKNSSKKLVRT